MTAEGLVDGGQVPVIRQVLQVAGVHAQGSHPAEVLYTRQRVLRVGRVHGPETNLDLLEQTLGLETKQSFKGWSPLLGADPGIFEWGAYPPCQHRRREA